jgi:hypothetical protein
MKIIVLHDDQGNILSLGIPGSEFGQGISMEVDKGQQVAEVDLPDLTENVIDGKGATNEASLRRLSDVLENHRLEIASKYPKLVHK